MIRNLIQAIQLGFRAEAIFAVTMMAATMLGFLKTIVLASILPAEVFGFYITALGASSIVALFSTFGDVEQTYKLYPQQYATGHINEMWLHIKKLIKKLIIRGLALCIVASLICYFFSDIELSPFNAALIILTGLAIVLQMLMASIIRAVDPSKLLPLFTFARGFAALTLCVLIAMLTKNWRLILFVEALSMIIVFTGMVVMIKFSLKQETSTASYLTGSLAYPHQPADKVAGKKIYLAALIASLIPFGGRAFILALAGPVVAGAYGLLTVLVQAGQMLAGTLSQKLGPALLREAATRGDGERKNAVQRFALPVLFLWGAAFGTFLLCWVSMLFPYGKEFWGDYNISLFILALTSFQMAMTAFLYLHFAVMAENRESDLIFAAILSIIVFFGGFLITAKIQFGLAGYVTAAAVAYASHTFYLLLRYRKFLKIIPI